MIEFPAFGSQAVGVCSASVVMVVVIAARL